MSEASSQQSRESEASSRQSLGSESCFSDASESEDEGSDDSFVVSDSVIEWESDASVSW